MLRALSLIPLGWQRNVGPMEGGTKEVESDTLQILSGLCSKTPPEGYSVFLSFGSSMCKTEIEHARVPFSKRVPVKEFS